MENEDSWNNKLHDLFQFIPFIPVPVITVRKYWANHVSWLWCEAIDYDQICSISARAIPWKHDTSNKIQEIGCISYQ